jgi:hypothetical protein
MRLLHTTRLTLEDFLPNQEPPYAILSHTWGDSEITYDHLTQNGTVLGLPSNEKILGACKVALENGHEYIWVDTCCINKSSSAELQEAINSMFQWYKSSVVCYAYISDFRLTDPVDSPRKELDLKSLGKSRWFTRGWTLQELLAPSIVTFFDAYWKEIGSKSSLRPLLSQYTGIPGDALQGRDLHLYDVNEKFAWARNRQTLRPEDRAYALLGIFDVSMPMIYGEGHEKALWRLHKEIREVQKTELPTWPSSSVSNDRGGRLLQIGERGVSNKDGALVASNDEPKPYYLSPNFKPEMATPAELRKILRENGVRTPMHSSKRYLVDEFRREVMEKTRPQNRMQAMLQEASQTLKSLGGDSIKFI